LAESLEEMVVAEKISMYPSYSAGIVRINLYIKSQSYAFLAQITQQVSELGFKIDNMDITGFTMTKSLTVDEFAELYKKWSS
jgi:hypothetical protein